MRKLSPQQMHGPTARCQQLNMAYMATSEEGEGIAGSPQSRRAIEQAQVPRPLGDRHGHPLETIETHTWSATVDSMGRWRLLNPHALTAQNHMRGHRLWRIWGSASALDDDL